MYCKYKLQKLFIHDLLWAICHFSALCIKHIMNTVRVYFSNFYYMPIDHMKGEQYENYFDFSDHLSQLCIFKSLMWESLYRYVPLMYRNAEGFESWNCEVSGPKLVNCTLRRSHWSHHSGFATQRIKRCGDVPFGLPCEIGGVSLLSLTTTGSYLVMGWRLNDSSICPLGWMRQSGVVLSSIRHHCKETWHLCARWIHLQLREILACTKCYEPAFLETQIMPSLWTHLVLFNLFKKKFLSKHTKRYMSFENRDIENSCLSNPGESF